MPLPASWSLSVYYLTTFAVMGVYLPYFNLYAKSLGFTGLQIGIVTLLIPLSSALVPALGGVLVDRSGRRRALILATSLLALLTFSLVLGVRTFAAIVVVIALYAALRAPALPLIEASAMALSEAGGPHYGRMRVWGSLAFIVAALATGPLVAQRGERAVVPLVIALLALNALAAFLLPRDGPAPPPRDHAAGLGRFVRQPRVLLFLLACLLSQAAHGPFYVFYSIHLQRSGYRPSAIGALWTVAVGCEILAMLMMPRLLERAAPLSIMGACVVLASVRWGICAASTAPSAMVLAQALHAATYAAFHVAAVTHTHRLFGESRRASGQSVYGSATYGVGNLVGMYLSGVLYDRVSMSTLYLGASAASLLAGLAIVGAQIRDIRPGSRLYFPA